MKVRHLIYYRGDILQCIFVCLYFSFLCVCILCVFVCSMVYRESVTCSVEGGIWPSVMTLISARGDKDRRGYSRRKGEFDDNAIYGHKDAGFIR